MIQLQLQLELEPQPQPQPQIQRDPTWDLVELEFREAMELREM